MPNTFCIINDEVLASSVVLQTQFYRMDWVYVVSQNVKPFSPDLRRHMGMPNAGWHQQKVMDHEMAFRLTGEILFDKVHFIFSDTHQQSGVWDSL